MPVDTIPSAMDDLGDNMATTQEAPAEEPAPCTRFDPLAVLPEPAAERDWNRVKRHYRRYGSPEATAAKYDIALRDLRTRARWEAWEAGSKCANTAKSGSEACMSMANCSRWLSIGKAQGLSPTCS